MMAWLLFCAIELSGVTGADLESRAFFDAHNVKVGDPMVLTVDFFGEADFGELHPPELAATVNGPDWKLDDVSAKTDTLNSGETVVGRRITYRVRPRRAGVLTFPGLEFTYRTSTGRVRTVRTRAMPVHAKAGRQVTVAEVGEDLAAMPMPDALITKCPAGVVGDEEFAWRKACASPSAKAFEPFDFPEARLNEARCAILEGNWSRALSIYRILEWQTGQTPAIEHGMVAAWARRFENPAAQLPVWRQVGRPLLKFAWLGRLAWVLGTFFSLVIVVWLLNRGIRAMAAIAAALLLVWPVLGEETVQESVVTNADGSVVHRVVRTSNGRNGSMSFSFSSSSGGSGMPAMPSMSSMFDDDFFASPFGRRRKAEPVRIAATARADRQSAAVGESFRILLTVEMPRRIRFEKGLSFALEERPGLSMCSQPEALGEQNSTNAAYVIRRYAFHYRSLQPFAGALRYAISGEVITGGFGFFRSTEPYRQNGEIAGFRVNPLPTANRPADFSGIVAEQVTVSGRSDLAQVETNDVITLTYRVRSDGYVPRRVLPESVAYEWQRNVGDSEVEYRRYFVADGARSTPEFSVSYYDPKRREYRRSNSVSTPIRYR